MWRKEGLNVGNLDGDTFCYRGMSTMVTWNGPWGRLEWNESLRREHARGLRYLCEALNTDAAVVRIWDELVRKGRDLAAPVPPQTRVILVGGLH